MSDQEKRGSATITIPLPPATPLTEKDAKLVDSIQHNVRVAAAVAALQAVIGKNNYVQVQYADGGAGPHDANQDYLSAFSTRLTALLKNPENTVHIAANQAIRELGFYSGDPKDKLSTADFDKVYHATLDKLHVPQLPHEKPFDNKTGKNWDR
jgi:hypothetical protein